MEDADDAKSTLRSFILDRKFSSSAIVISNQVRSKIN